MLGTKRQHAGGKTSQVRNQKASVKKIYHRKLGTKRHL